MTNALQHTDQPTIPGNKSLVAKAIIAAIAFSILSFVIGVQFGKSTSENDQSVTMKDLHNGRFGRLMR